MTSVALEVAKWGVTSLEGEKILMRAPNVYGRYVGPPVGTSSQEQQKTADGGGLGTYNSRSGRPRQGSQATTPPVASLLADPSSA